MPNKVRVYTWGMRPLAAALVFCIGGFICFGAFYLIEGSLDGLSPIALALWVILFSVSLILSGYRLTVAEDTISSSWFWRRETIEWTNLSPEATFTSTGTIIVRNHSHSRTIKLRSFVTEFLELITLIYSQHPELLLTKHADRFRRSPFAYLFWGIIAALGASLVLIAFLDVDPPIPAIIGALLILLVGLLGMATRNHSLTLIDDQLQLKSFLDTTSAHVSEVTSLHLENDGGLSSFRVRLQLRDRDDIKLSHFRVGPLVLFFTLQAWLADNEHSVDSIIGPQNAPFFRGISNTESTS